MKNLYQFFVLLCVQMTLCSTAFANFNTAMEIYTDKRFDEAKVAFETLSAIGDRASLFNLGVMYYRGEAVVSDPVMAYVLMRLAAGDDSEEFSKVAAKIYGTFDDQQKNEAKSVMLEMELIYSDEAITQSIFPSPLEDEECAPELLPLLKVAPMYPRSEQFQGRMGMTIAEYTVSPQGYVRDIYVERSTNRNFTKASVKSAKRFRYTPPIDGKPIFGTANKFTFMIETSGDGDRVSTGTIRSSIEKLKSSAEQNDAVSQYSYARALNDYRTFQSYLGDMDLQYREANMWFEKSAKNGLANAQYVLGKNMMEGRGCEVDEENGLKWVKAAAVAGYSPAQQMLAHRFSQSDQSTLAVMSWLRGAALSGYSPAIVELAWELATTHIAELRDANESLSLLEGDTSGYYDDVRVLEIKAAAHAMLGDYKKAMKLQKKAIGLADDLEWSIPIMHERLGLYEHEEPWVGRYYQTVVKSTGP